jgi:hypothetical protein
MKMSSNEALVLGEADLRRGPYCRWAACVSFVFHFLVAVAPQLSAFCAQAGWQCSQDGTAEHESYCAKFGMPTGTAGLSRRLADLQEFRAKVEQRVADDDSF